MSVAHRGDRRCGTPVAWRAWLGSAVLGAALAQAAAGVESWHFQPLGPPASAGVTSIDFDPVDADRLWIGRSPEFSESPSLWLSTTGGGGWRNRAAGLSPDGLARLLVTPLPGAKRQLLAVAADADCLSRVQRSEDAGATWVELASRLDLGCPGGALVVSASDPNQVWTAFGGDLTHSLDGGRTWRKSPVDFGNAEQIALSPLDPDVVLVREWGTIYRSGDHGESFVSRLQAEGDVRFLADGTAYVDRLQDPFRPNDPGCVAVSADAGVTFVVRPGPAGVDCRHAQVQADGAGVFWLADGELGVWRSVDRGQSWQPSEIPKLPEAGRMVPHPFVPGRFYLLGQGRTIWRLDAASPGVWRGVGSGLTLAETLEFARTPARRWALVLDPAARRGGRLLAEAKPGSWAVRRPSATAFAVDPFDEDHVLAGVQVSGRSVPEARLAESFDGGLNWSGADRPLPLGPRPFVTPQEVREIRFDPRVRGRAYAMVSIAGFLERAPGGEWSRREDGFPKNRLACFHGYCASIAIGSLQAVPAGLFLRVGSRVLFRAAGTVLWKDTRFPGVALALASDAIGEVFGTDLTAGLSRWRPNAQRPWTSVGRVWDARRGFVGAVNELAAIEVAGESLLVATTDRGELLVGRSGGGDFEAITPPGIALGVGSSGGEGILRTDQGAYWLRP